MRMRALMKYGKEIGHDIDLMVAATTGDRKTIDLLNLYDVRYNIYANQPLGAKWNAAIEWALSSNTDYFVITGSDDLILDSYLDRISMYLENQIAWGGLLQAYMLAHPGNAGLIDYQRNKVLGAGTFISYSMLFLSAEHRMVKKWKRASNTHYDQALYLPGNIAKYFLDADMVELHEQIVHRLWPDDLKESFDLMRDIRIVEATGIQPVHIAAEVPHMICLKAKESIRTWEYMKRAQWIKNDVPAQTVLSLLSNEEREYWETNIKNK
jgi:glycosyltransferase involved in cell wall biosynthesis